MVASVAGCAMRVAGCGWRVAGVSAAPVWAVIALLLLLLLLLLLPGSGWAQGQDQRMMEGLRQRRLFSLAETYGRGRLDDGQLSQRQRVQLVIELIRTQAQHAVHSSPQDRPARWQQARQTAAQFLEQHEEHPRAVLVRVQDALTVLAEGELGRQEAEVASQPEGPREAARQTLRQALRLLEQLDRQLSQQIPLRQRRAGDEAELSAGELLSLHHHVHYQLARASRNQALCYPAGSDDRVAGLTQALDWLQGPLTQLDAAHPLVWKLRIDQVVCYRLLGDFGRAGQILAGLEQQGMPADVQLLARAEQVRLKLAAGQPEQAVEQLGQGRQAEGRASAELDFAHLETYLALWQQAAEAGQQQRLDQWRQKAVEAVRFLEQTHGPYWGRRAERLLVKSAGQRDGHGDWEILRRTADHLYLKGQPDEAVAAYEQAAAGAESAGQPDQAFQLAYKAALVQQQRGEHTDAARRLEALAVNNRAHSDAARAHLLAGWNAAQAARSQSQMLARYERLLRQHLDTWPDADTAASARLWLGRLHQNRQDWPAALAAYQGVSPQSDQFATAVQSAARCWSQWLDQLQADGQPSDQQARAAVDFFQNVIRDPDNGLPSSWSALQRCAAVAAARIALQHLPDGFATAQRLLEPALADADDAPADWTASARSLLVVALAGQPQHRQSADKMLRQMSDAPPEQLLDMLVGLSVIAQSAGPQVQAELAALQLQASELLWPARQQLGPADGRTLQQLRAEALAAAGHSDQARTAYAQLAREHPDNGQIQQAYAQLLLDSDDPQLLEQALGQWRRVASRSRPRSESWYRAKYSVALAQYKQGDKQQAAQLIRYLQATPPGLQDTALKPRFLELLQRCQQ